MVASTGPSFPTGSAPDEAPGPYHLHPQRGSPPGDTSGDRDRPRSSGLRSPEVAQTLGKGDTATARQTESSHAEAGGNRKVPAQPRQNVPETQEAAAGKQSKNSLKLKWSPLPAKRNPERTREDIVERNKITLGRNTSKRGSYLKAHAPQQGTDDVTVCGEGKITNPKVVLSSISFLLQGSHHRSPFYTACSSRECCVFIHPRLLRKTYNYRIGPAGHCCFAFRAGSGGRNEAATPSV